MISNIRIAQFGHDKGKLCSQCSLKLLKLKFLKTLGALKLVGSYPCGPHTLSLCLKCVFDSFAFGQFFALELKVKVLITYNDFLDDLIGYSFYDFNLFSVVGI